VTAAHFIYIPMVVMAGIIIGFILGGRVARNAFDLELKREREREEARRVRAERKAAREAAKAAADDS
jgi:hypothetical protein